MTSKATSLVANPIAQAGSLSADAECQQLVSELFHDLSQPLSTLVCLLEVNLLLARPAKQLRRDLQIALEQAKSIVRFDRDLRELWQAGNAQHEQQVLSLASCLREVAADLLPVAEAAKVKLSLTATAECLVNFQPSRLRQALFHLLEFTLSSCSAGTGAKIAASEAGEVVRVKVAIPSVVEPGPRAAAGSKGRSATQRQHEMKRRLGLAIARRIFEAAHASLCAGHSGEQLCIEVQLPLVWLAK
jgi:K+-sensing histidine kinase KdpD